MANLALLEALRQRINGMPTYPRTLAVDEATYQAVTDWLREAPYIRVDGTVRFKGVEILKGE